MSNYRQRPDGMYEVAARLFPGGRTYVAVTSEKPTDVTLPDVLREFSIQCARTAAGFQAMAAALRSRSHPGT